MESRLSESRKLLNSFRKMNVCRIQAELNINEEFQHSKLLLDSLLINQEKEILDERDKAISSAEDSRKQYLDKAAEITQQAEHSQKWDAHWAQRQQFKTMGRCEECGEALGFLNRLFKSTTCNVCQSLAFLQEKFPLLSTTENGIAGLVLVVAMQEASKKDFWPADVPSKADWEEYRRLSETRKSRRIKNNYIDWR